MASKFTYQDFQQAVSSSGLGSQFSAADLKLAQQNPDAGMSILKYKKGWNAATTDEARALANMGAEQVRSSWGGYTGGQSGGSFYLDAISPNDFSYGPAPTYNNRYDATIQDLLGQIVNREKFSYDPDTDPLYSQYRKQYTREGQRATADALGAAAAASGGIPSSYATTAAGQAGDYYAARMTDKIPELYQLAYNQYMNEHSMKLGDLDAVRGAEQSDYQKYLNDLSQYNTDRSFAYGQHLDEIGQQAQVRGEALDKAQLAAGYGDYSFLNDMGIKTDNSQTEWERQYNLAQLAAQYGDYSGLRSLGVSPDANGLYQFNLAASGGNRAAVGSSGSRGSGGGSSSSGGKAGQEESVLATMLALGDDYLAREYLIGRGYSNTVYEDFWDMYQDAKESGWGGYGGGSDNTAGLPTPGAGSGSTDTYETILNAYKHIGPGTGADIRKTFSDRIDRALEAGTLTGEEANSLLNMVGIKKLGG